MKTYTATIGVDTKKQFELIDLTAKVTEVVKASGVQQGIVVIFNPHTTAAVRVNHNEPLLLQDIMKTLFRLVPVDISYSHDLFELRENPELGERSNGHAHVKAFLLGSSESLIVENAQLVLGPKQSIFLVELDGGRARNVRVQIVGE